VDACFTVYPIIYLEIYFLLCDHSNLKCFYNTFTGGEILAYLLYKILFVSSAQNLFRFPIYLSGCN